MFQKIAYAALALFIGAALIWAGAREAVVYVKKTTVPLNSASISEFDKIAFADGEIACVLGEFATMTQTEKVLGFIPTSKRETSYYLVENFTRDEIVKIENGEETERDGFVYVVAATKDETKAALNANFKAWMDYDDGKSDTIPDAVHFEGKLWKQSNEDDYLQYRDDFLKECGLDYTYLAEYRAQDTKIGLDSFAVIAIGIGCLIFGIVDSLLVFRKWKASKAQF